MSFDTTKLLTPKDLADALGASESSMRRWVDAGKIKMSRTAGGHRRIPLEEAIRFIRESGSPLVRPSLLGLPESSRISRKGLRDEDLLLEALSFGDRNLARSVVTGWFVESRSLAEIFDQQIATCLHRVGELWEHEERGILIEHRATEMCVEIIAELKRLLPQLAQDAPVSLGGAPGNDIYSVPTMMVGAVLLEAGYRDINFGANTPISLLVDAAIEHDAKLVWVSVSVSASDHVKSKIALLARSLRERGTRLVLGGREVSSAAPEPLLDNTWVLESMTALAEHVKQIKPESNPGPSE
jgi:MerR family transcriptional regulator, light-induced transcriptional regulator